MSLKHVDIHGRALLEVREKSAAIFVLDRLDGDFHQIPRPVKHVGEHKYIMRIWNKMKRNNKYLKNPVTIEEAMDKWAKEIGIK